MACNVGSFSTGTGAVSSTVAVTGVGFQPTFVLFWWSGRTDTTDAAGSGNHRFGYGVISATERMCVISHSTDGGASASSDGGQRFDACVASMSTTGAIDGLLDFSSFDADGFTLVVDDVMPDSMRVHYMAFDSITDVDLGFFVEPATATTQDINIGWTPSGDDTAVFFMHFSNTTADPPVTGTDSRRSFGVCAGATPTNYCWGGGSNDGAATMQSISYCRGGECIVGFDGGAAASNQRAAVTAWITNGFRLTWNEVTGNNIRRVLYAAVRGGKWFAGDFLSQTNTTAFSETGVGFQPIGGFFVSQCATENAADTPTAHDQGSLGAAGGGLNQRCMSMIDEDNTANAEVATAVEHDEMYTRMGTADAKVGGCAINSWDSDGFTAQMTDADPDQAFIWYLLHGESGLTISPGGIASAEAFGTSQLNRDLISGSVPSAEAFGNASINREVRPSSITSLEAFGTSRVDMSILLTGITSQEAFGNPTIEPGNVDVSPSGVPSAEAFGNASINQAISPSGVPSEEAFGAPQLNRTLTAAPVNSGEVFGTTTINQEVSPTDIASAETFGTPTVEQGATLVEPSGVPSEEAFGSPQLDRTLPAAPATSAEAFGTAQLDRTLPAASVASAEAFGNPTIVEEVRPVGIPSEEAFGSAQIDRTLPAGSAPTAEAFGTPEVQAGGAQIEPTGVPSEEAFGDVKLDRTLPVDSVPSAEAFGTTSINEEVRPSGVPSEEVFGTPEVEFTATQIQPPGIPSAETFGTTQLDRTLATDSVPTAEAFGTPDVSQNSFVFPEGIPSAETFGIPQLNRDLLAAGVASAEAFGLAVIVLEVRPSGVASAEAFGTAAIHRTLPVDSVPSGEAFGNPTMVLFVGPNGIPSAEAFGVPMLVLTISPSGIASLEVFGTATIQQGGPVITATGIPSGEVFGIPLIQTAGSSGSPNEPAGMSQSVGQTFVTVSIGTPYDPTGGTSTPGSGSSVGTPYKPGGGVP